MKERDVISIQQLLTEKLVRGDVLVGKKKVGKA